MKQFSSAFLTLISKRATSDAELSSKSIFELSRTLLTEYAYVLKPGGRLYTITDVEDLYEWEVDHLERHPLFRRIPNEEMKDSVFVKLMHTSTDEAQKVDRKSGSKYFAVYERIDPEISSKTHEERILDLLI